ncbi:MAG TPA: diguanylate cyclase [Marinagarivorans sp.]
MTRALVVDQQPERAKNTEFYLQQEGYKTAIAEPGKVCKKTWETLLPDIIVLTVDGWQDQSINTLIELKSATKTKSIPVIVIASCSDPQTLIYSLDLGAHECVLEPTEPQVLAARIRSVLTISDRQKKLELANSELAQLASTDALTHVYNRRHFFTQSHAEFARAKRYNRGLSVIMLDIDDFKMVNDRYGHAAGDMALVSLAECCRSVVRESDIVGRLGGEEFAVCCPEADLEGAKIIAERIRLQCEQTLLSYQDQPFCITVSLGVTPLTGQDDTFENIMLRADRLLYQAKDRGRNCAIASACLT